MNKNIELLSNCAKDFNINLSQEQLNQFEKYWQFLDEYNKHTNLVSSSEAETVFKKHFIDSLAIGLINELDREKTLKSIDIGIGGGFPGIPIIIAFTNWKLCAVDSVGKKTKFIELLSAELGISDRVEVINTRAEDLARISGKREKFDFAVTRAVAQLNVISEYCLPFVKVGGYFVAYKAKNIKEEISNSKKALLSIGGKIEAIKKYSIPENEIIERNLVLIKKEKRTPEKFPRKAGIPAKNPII